MAWVFLCIAGVLEIVWAFSMKQSGGFTKLYPSIITITAMIGSVIFLSISMKNLPLGTAYTVWTGIGAVGAFLAGIIFLGESTDSLRLLAALLIIMGLFIMKLAS